MADKTSNKKHILLWIAIGIFWGFLSCHDNKKLPEGRFVLFGDYQSPESQEGWKGLQNLKDFRYSDIFYHDNTARSNREIALIEKEIEARTSLIWFGFPFLNTGAFQGIMRRHPHQKFAFLDEVDIPKEIPDNVVVVEFQMQEAGYVAGYVAAHATRKKRIAVITQSPTSYQKTMILGFIAGVLAVNPQIEIIYEDVPVFVGEQFVYAMTQELTDKGADLIFSILGNMSERLLNLASEKNFYVISGNRHDSEANLWSKNYLGYVFRHVDLATFYISNSVLDERSPVSKVVRYGLADGMVSFIKNPSLDLGNEVLKKVENLMPRIILGEIPILLDKEEMERLAKNVRMRRK
ncbi:MAG: BMP family lipoprotein [Spirochaetia bacterium]